MQISVTSSAGSAAGLQARRDIFQSSTDTSTGQTLPTLQSQPFTEGAVSAPPPEGLGGGRFNFETLASLLGAQEGGFTPGSRLVEAADSNGDGTVGIDELATSLNADASRLTEAFGRVDSDADGALSVDELSSAFEAMIDRGLSAYSGKTDRADPTASLAA